MEPQDQSFSPQTQNSITNSSMPSDPMLPTQDQIPQPYVKHKSNRIVIIVLIILAIIGCIGCIILSILLTTKNNELGQVQAELQEANATKIGQDNQSQTSTNTINAFMYYNDQENKQVLFYNLDLNHVIGYGDGPLNQWRADSKLDNPIAIYKCETDNCMLRTFAISPSQIMGNKAIIMENNSNGYSVLYNITDQKIEYRGQTGENLGLDEFGGLIHQVATKSADGSNVQLNVDNYEYMLLPTSTTGPIEYNVWSHVRY